MSNTPDVPFRSDFHPSRPEGVGAVLSSIVPNVYRTLDPQMRKGGGMVGVEAECTMELK